MSTRTYTKKSLAAELLKIKNRGWIEQTRNVKNAGALGNTLEDLLGIAENNLPIPNAAEWELKTQRKNTNSLLTLFHMEPSPTALKIVPWLLENFGWPHEKAGATYPQDEKSFRQTLSYHNTTSRGFDLNLDENNKKVFVSFDFNQIHDSLTDWKKTLVERQSMKLDKTHIPYWGYSDLFHKAGMKLKNCFFVIGDEKRENGKTFIRYDKIMVLSNFVLENLIEAIRQGDLYIDFDARSGHNHGTKFRIRRNAFPELYKQRETIE